MRTAVKNITVKFLAFLMIGLIVMLIVNRAVFLHSHKLADGTIIVHAHPYDKSTDSTPFKTHHHSNGEFFFFQNLNILFHALFAALTFVLFAKKVKVFFQFRVIYHPIYINFIQGRAPPIL